MTPLTKKQAALLDFIKGLIDQDGAAPSLREMAAMLGKNHSTVHRMICKIEKCGWVKIQRTKSHAIKIVAAADDALKSDERRLRALLRPEQADWLIAAAEINGLSPAALLREILDPEFRAMYSGAGR